MQERGREAEDTACELLVVQEDSCLRAVWFCREAVEIVTTSGPTRVSLPQRDVLTRLSVMSGGVFLEA